MKKLLYIIIPFLSLTFCYGQNLKISDYIKSLGNGYYSITNHIDNKLLLPNYQNYKSGNDSIFLEKIHYQYETDNFLLVIGNMIGSKSSLVLALRKDKGKCNVIFAEGIAFIDTIEKEIVKDYTFFLLSSHHADMCGEREGLTIYVLDNLKLYKSFEGLRKEEFYDTGDSLCVRGVSYTQGFMLKLNNNDIMLIAEKKNDDKKNPELKEYYFKNYQFK